MDENEQAKEVYARYGRAMLRAQNLERALASAMLVFKLLPNVTDTAKSPDEREQLFDAFWEQQLKKTLGGLVTDRVNPGDGHQMATSGACAETCCMETSRTFVSSQCTRTSRSVFGRRDVQRSILSCMPLKECSWTQSVQPTSVTARTIRRHLEFFT
jgi:hypothetical protein